MKHTSKEPLKKPLWIALACVAAVVVIALCLWFFWLRGLFAAGNASPVYVESVANIAGVNVGDTPRYSGVVEPQETYSIQKDESKTVAEVYVTQGDEVSPGDALFRYDTQEMQMSLDQSQLDLESISNTIATLKKQKEDLEKEKKEASQEEQYQYTVQIQSVELQIKTEEYNSQTKQQEIEELKDSLENAEVFSEVAGVVKEVNETPATDSSGQPKPFISILSSGEFRVKGTVSELNIGSLYQGQPVVIYSRLDSQQTWSGVIGTIETEPTQQNNNMYYGMDSGQQSSKYNFYVTLSSLEGLMLGQHVYIQPDLGQGDLPEGLWLPSYYIVQDENGSFVWAQSGKNTLEKRAVVLGEYDAGNDRYLIESGLTEDDSITAPAEDLKEGTPTTSDLSQVPVTDPSTDGSMDGSIDGGMVDNGGVVDGGTVDDGMVDDGTVDPGIAVPYTEEEPVDDSAEAQTYDTEDGESTSDSLESSPMEDLAR